jgi:hypothetical protein
MQSAAEVREALHAEVGDHPIRDFDVFCVDPLPRRYEVNLSIPAEVGAGRHQLAVALAGRRFAPIEIQLAE